MKSELRIEKPHRRSDGQVGARATVSVPHDTRPQDYSFDTHGMTSREVVGKIADIERYHAAKVERMDRFRRLHGMVVARGYTIVDCTILDAGVTLYIDVRPQAKGFPFQRAYQSISAIPTNDAILKIIAAALPDVDAIESAHAEFVAKVEARRA